MLINRFLIIQKQLDSNYTVKNSKLHSNSRSKVHEGTEFPVITVARILLSKSDYKDTLVMCMKLE